MAQPKLLSVVELHRILIVHFDVEELKTLCFDLEVDYDSLGGEGLKGKARELVKMMQRYGLLEKLEAAVRLRRPQLKTISPPLPTSIEDEQKDLELELGLETDILRTLEFRAAQYSTQGDLPQELGRRLGEQREKVASLKAKQYLLKDFGYTSWPLRVDNLPRAETFFGRTKEIEMAMETISPAETRSWGVLIDGLGGIGKTALALEVARRSREKRMFKEYVWVSAKTSELVPEGIRPQEAHFTSAGTLFDAIARELGLFTIHRLSSNEEKSDALRVALRERQALLVLVDNLETLNTEDQQEVIKFLRRLPEGCKAIATSRQRHGTEDARIIRLSRLPWEDARRLIEAEGKKEQRVQEKLEKVGDEGWLELYDAAGGSPLAIIWTIGLMRIRHKTFESALSMLHEGSQTNDLHQFIYEEAISKLDSDSKRLLAALSLFPAAASEKALQSVTALPWHKLSKAIEMLFQLSFLIEVDYGDGVERLDLHPITRRFGSTLDVQFGGLQSSKLPELYVRYWLEFMQEHGLSDWQSYPEIERELDNILAAVTWVHEKWDRESHENGDLAGDQRGFLQKLFPQKRASMPVQTAELARLVVEFGAALSTFLYATGHWTWGLDLYKWAVEASNQLEDWSSVGRRSYDVGWLYAQRGELEQAIVWAERSREAFEKSGNRVDGAEARRLMGVIAEYRGDLEKAEAIYKEVLKTYEEEGVEEEIGFLMLDLGDLARRRNELPHARQYYERALTIWQASEKPAYGAAALNGLGLTSLMMNDYSSARAYFEQALSEAQHVEKQALAKWGLARIEEHEGRLENALKYAMNALQTYEELQLQDVEQLRVFINRLGSPRGGES